MNNDELALERTKIANQRTFLAYSRTAIMVFATGITFLKLLSEDEVLRVTGWVLVPLSILLFLYGMVSYVRFNQRLHRSNISKT